MDACSLLCAPTLGRSVRHGQIIRSRAVRLSSRCSSSVLTEPEIQMGTPMPLDASCCSLMLALNRALTDWHDNSPFNSPPALAVTLSLHLSHLSFVPSSDHLSYSPSVFCHLDSSPLPLPRWHSPAILSSPRLTGWPSCPSSSPPLL